jgi:hypothetical protein
MKRCCDSTEIPHKASIKTYKTKKTAYQRDR